MNKPITHLLRGLLGAASLSLLAPTGRAGDPVQIIRQLNFKNFAVNVLPGDQYYDCPAGSSPRHLSTDLNRITPLAGSPDIYGPVTSAYISGYLRNWFKGTANASGVWQSQNFPGNFTDGSRALGCTIYAGGAADCGLLQKREYTICDERTVTGTDGHRVYLNGDWRYTGFAMKLGTTTDGSGSTGFNMPNPTPGWTIVFQWRSDGTQRPAGPILWGVLERAYGGQLNLNIYAQSGVNTKTTTTLHEKHLVYQIPAIARGAWHQFVFATRFGSKAFNLSGGALGQVQFWHNGIVQLVRAGTDKITSTPYHWDGWCGWDDAHGGSSTLVTGLYRYLQTDKNATVFYDKIRIARHPNNNATNDLYYATNPSGW
jgi:hypothetical protein